MSSLILPTTASCPFGINSAERIEKTYPRSLPWCMTLKSTEGEPYKIVEKNTVRETTIQHLLDLEKAKKAGYIPLLHLIVGVSRIALSIFLLCCFGWEALQNRWTYQKMDPAAQKLYSKNHEDVQELLLETVREVSCHAGRGFLELALGPILWIPDQIIDAYEQGGCSKQAPAVNQ